jgi:hypothetical protein
MKPKQIPGIVALAFTMGISQLAMAQTGSSNTASASAAQSQGYPQVLVNHYDVMFVV